MTCIISALLLASPSLHDLAYRRGDFEARTSHKLYVMAMNSDGFNSAYYPVGSATTRYLVDYGGLQTLIFEEIEHGKIVVKWTLPLRSVPYRTGNQKGGTLQRELTSGGLRVSRRHLTASQRAALSARKDFVSYSLGAETNDLGVTFVPKDGKSSWMDIYDPNPQELRPPFLPIPAQESKLLGLGGKEWHDGAKVTIRRTR